MHNEIQDTVTKHILDTLTARFYNVFTNTGDSKPQVERIYDLFIAKAIIIKNSGLSPEIYSLSEFVIPREKLLTDGRLIDFKEEEIDESTTVFGNIAQRISFYKKSGILEGKEFKTKGVKNIQFIHTSEGWKMNALTWDDEREGFSIPIY
ncbi:hypothetical protein [Flavobacterium sp. '19STA2R22 D10 B1']|uniref:hypothetical protein n=1 Tax=Flavobacterium aerium TaxID=3037261 RepID=UPI00278BB290|nr:hypothetical protein [Flavobacterium sp. '19STA2R22 D10 B1']